MVTFDLEGFKLEFEITGWKPSPNGVWDSSWCNVKLEVKSSFMRYCIDYECLMSCEVEELLESLNNAIAGGEAEDMSCYESDFEFVFYKASDVLKDSVQMDWVINFWHEGALTANSLRLCLDKEDMIALRDYLKLVVGGVEKE